MEEALGGPLHRPWEVFRTHWARWIVETWFEILSRNVSIFQWGFACATMAQVNIHTHMA